MMDGRTMDKQTDIGGCRVAFATENKSQIFPVFFDNYFNPKNDQLILEL